MVIDKATSTDRAQRRREDWLVALYVWGAFLLVSILHLMRPLTLLVQDKVLSVGLSFLIGAVAGGGVLYLRRRLYGRGAESRTWGWGPESTCGTAVLIWVLVQAAVQASLVLRPSSAVYLPFLFLTGGMIGVSCYLEASWASDQETDRDSIKLQHQLAAVLISSATTALGVVVAVMAASGVIGGYLLGLAEVPGRGVPSLSFAHATALLGYFVIGYILWFIRVLHRQCRVFSARLDRA